MSARSSHLRPEGRPEAPYPASVVLVRPSWIARRGNVGDLALRGSSNSGGASISCSTRSRATSLRRRPPDANAKRRMARSRVLARRSVAQVAISRSKTSRARPRRGANGPSIPLQRWNVLQLASRLLTVARGRAATTQQAIRLQAFGDVREHPMSGIARALRRIPEMMRHEFQRQPLRRRHDGGWPVAASAQITK